MKITNPNTLALLKRLSGFFWLRTDLDFTLEMPRRFARAYRDHARQQDVWVLAPFHWLIVLAWWADNHWLSARRSTWIDRQVKAIVRGYDQERLRITRADLARLWQGEPVRYLPHNLTLIPPDKQTLGKADDRERSLFLMLIKQQDETAKYTYLVGVRDTKIVSMDSQLNELVNLAFNDADPDTMKDAYAMHPSWRVEQVRAYIYILRSRITDLVREARAVANAEAEFQQQRSDQGEESFHDELSDAIKLLGSAVAAAESALTAKK